jgi:small subunit ribosomal protein S6
MPLYETIFIARQDVSTAQVEALTDGFATGVGERGGEVKKREYWGLRNLSYRIKKNRKATTCCSYIEAPAPAVIEMERTMRLNEDVLRYLTVKVETLEEGPSAMMQRRDERGDRDRDAATATATATAARRRARARRVTAGAMARGSGRWPARRWPAGDGPRGDGPRGDGHAAMARARRSRR